IDLTYTYTLLYEQIGNYKKVSEYLKKHFAVKEESINADRDGAVARLRLEYETEKKENQLKEQKRISKIAVGIGIFTFLITLILFFFFKKYKQLSKENAALVGEQNHRVKNNLQQVTNLISLQSTRLKDEEAKRAMNEALLRVEAMALVHQRLYDSERLIEINLFTYIPKLTTGILRSYNYIKLIPNYELDDLWLHVDQAIPLGLILNELVTNSCKYAFADNLSPELLIECYLADGSVNFRFTDNGPGFDTSTQHKTFGLKLIQIFSERLKGEHNFSNQGRMFQLVFKKRISENKKRRLKH
ncbi:MAG TPA: sensor histidine kinase, partial [Emticicia sp.]